MFLSTPPQSTFSRSLHKESNLKVFIQHLPSILKFSICPSYLPPLKTKKMETSR